MKPRGKFLPTLRITTESTRGECLDSFFIDEVMILCRWKDLLVERKEQSKRASGLAKDATEGKLKIEADQRWRILFLLMLIR